MNTGEETDLRDLPFQCCTYLLFYLLLTKEVRTGAGFCPAKPAEPAEIFTDIGDVDVLVPHKRDPVAIFPPARLISSTKKVIYIRTGDRKKKGSLINGEAVAGQRV
jgi:hypothetical protein